MPGILTTLILLPLVGAAFIYLFIRERNDTCDRNARTSALWVSIATFVASLWLWLKFMPEQAGFQFVEKHAWFEGARFQYYLGIDGISLFMILLSTLLLPICILASWESIKYRVREYMICFLVLEAFLIGVFSALDAMLFYVFFEGMLIPMFLIIGIWGGQRRVYASYKFFLYTLFGSVLFLIVILYFYFAFGTMEIPLLMEKAPLLPLDVQKLLWLGMFASFAVKVPMWPVHTWLPDAHVQAPTAGSVILAGVLLKMGAYGFLRFSMPMLPAASYEFLPLMFGLSVIAVIYTSLVALVQEDMKKLIAYSSVAHMGFVTIGLFSFTVQGIDGALLQMISHGLVSGALFLCVGVIYDRMHTREIDRYGGLVNRMPAYAFVFLFFTMASVGLPGTSGFVGEFLVIMGIFQVSKTFALLTATGMVLGAAYALWLYRRVVLGDLTKNDLKKILDLNWREKLIFLPLIALVIWIGVAPGAYLRVIEPPVAALIKHIEVYKPERGR